MNLPEVWIETASSPAVYYPGSVIKGDVVMELMGRISQIRSIAVNLSGKVYTHWIQNEQTSRRRTHRVTYEYSGTVLNVHLNNILSTHNGITSTQSDLEPGRHKFPFIICLSKNLRLPTSFEYTDCPPPMSDLSGHIRYLLTTGISVTSGQSYTAVKGITVISNVDVNTPKLLRPLSSSNEKTVCCASGSVSLTVSTDRSAYCPGESIRINVDVENHSKRRIVEIRASLKQITLFSGNPNLMQSRLSSKTCKTVKIISAISSPAESKNMSLPIPITIPSIIECRGIQLFHILDVFLVLRNTLDLHVQLPIAIGTIPLKQPSTTLDSATEPQSTLPLEQGNLKYAPASTKQVYLGANTHIQGNLYYTPLYGYVENEVADSHST